MKRTTKNIWTALVLVIGLGVGFGASAALGTELPETENRWCTRDSDCDAYCGMPGGGVCHAWECYCYL